jgi:hypothetical protein
VTRAASGAFGIDVATVNARYHVDMTLDAAGLPSEVTVDRQGFKERHARRP